jgi:hypothetical protein
MGWNDVKSNKSSDSKSEIKYLSLKEGTTQIRILDDEPFSRYTHWLPKANEGKGTTVNCIGRDTCPVCSEIAKDRAAKATARFNSRKLHAMNVINRETGEVNILDKGNSLFEQLVGLYEEIGDLRNYDIKIRVSGTGKDTSYVVIPMAQKPLTADEKTLTKYDFSDMYKNLTPDQITTLMNGGSYKDIFNDANTDTVSDEQLNDIENTEEQPDIDFTK